MASLLDDFCKLPDFSAFDAFSQALWNNEAAVMVGSGFSRVCTRENDASMPPLWGDFAREMEKALGYQSGRGPDALRLAQEYQAQHGHDGLDRLIRRLVTDDQWEPSHLHRQLIEFPWRDILTTNWDTLLERTVPRTPDRIYSCVRTVHDIARQRSPRIVKLHGSLPSHTPLIFTEDDFRTYPSRFAPFVNLAQQVMLENELCLLGFSGVDPNFLAWSGWVRDTLSISARRIRLVGVLNLTPATRTLLEQRNVTPIDLWPLVKDFHPSQRHEQALSLLFTALIEARPPSPFEWKLESDRFNATPMRSDAEKATRRKVAEAWSKDRAAYPGWIVAPHSETWRLQHSFPRVQQSDEEPQDHLRFAAERIWRQRSACEWLHTSDLEEADKHYDHASGDLSPQQRTELCISAASQWRQVRKWEQWSKWMARLDAVAGDESRLWHAYETGLKAVLDWDNAKVQAAADALKSGASIWMMRRAALLSLLFQDRAAAELYQAGLMDVRLKLRGAPKSAWLISLEGWGSLFHRATHSALTDDITSFPEQDSDETRLRYVAAKADPWDEITRRDRLAFERSERNRSDIEEWQLAFRPGRFRQGGVRWRSGDGECPFYGLLQLMDKTGAPERSRHFNLFSDRLVAAYRALKKPDEDDLMIFLARYRGTNTKILNDILPRRRVARMSLEAVEAICEGSIRRVEMMLSDTAVSKADDHLRFLFALLARIVIRSVSAKAFEVFLWCQKVLVSPGLRWNCYEECEEVLKGAIEAMSKDHRQAALSQSLHLKLPDEAGTKGIAREWPELINEFSSVEIENLAVDVGVSRRIDQLIEFFRSGDRLNRTRAMTRLHKLFRAKKLSDVQINALENAIWQRCGEDGWPADTDLYPWVFLELPGCAKAEELFSASIVSALAEGDVSEGLLLNIHAGMERLTEPPDRDTLTACIEACIKWRPTQDDEDAIEQAFDNGAQKERATAKEIGYVLAHALLPSLALDDMTDDLTTAIKKIPDLGHVPTLSAVAFQLGRLCPEMKGVGIAMIRAAIASRDPDRVYPAFVAVKHYLGAVSEEVKFPYEITELLLHMIEQRLQPGLGSAMKFIGDLIEANVTSPNDIERLAKAIPDILEEYRYDQDRLSVPSLAELPEVRHQALRLIGLIGPSAPVLGALGIALASDPLPEVRRGHVS
jgi:hypothetical protein